MSDDPASILYPKKLEAPNVTYATPAGPTQTEPGSDVPNVVEPDNYGYETETPTENPYEEKTDSASRLYVDKQTIELSQDTDLSVLAQSPEEKTALAQSLGYMGHATGMHQSDITNLVDLANHHAISGPSEQSQEQTLANLYDHHGAQVHQRLRDAQDLIKSFPDAAAYIEASRLGDHPDFIDSVIRVSQTPRSQARLQKLRNSK